MFIYWSTWIGTGTFADPFRTTAQDNGADGACVDLRVDPTQATGRAIVASTVALAAPPAGVVLLLDTATQLDQVVPAAARNRVNNDLGLAVPPGLTFRQLIARLMTVDAVGRWGAVRGDHLFFGLAGSIALA